jgi:hypothetical protein
MHGIEPRTVRILWPASTRGSTFGTWDLEDACRPGVSGGLTQLGPSLLAHILRQVIQFLAGRQDLVLGHVHHRTCVTRRLFCRIPFPTEY